MQVCYCEGCFVVGDHLHRSGWAREISQNDSVWNDRACPRLLHAYGMYSLHEGVGQVDVLTCV